MKELMWGMKCSKIDLWFMVAILHSYKNCLIIDLTEFYDIYSVPYTVVKNKYIYN